MRRSLLLLLTLAFLVSSGLMGCRKDDTQIRDKHQQALQEEDPSLDEPPIE